MPYYIMIKPAKVIVTSLLFGLKISNGYCSSEVFVSGSAVFHSSVDVLIGNRVSHMMSSTSFTTC